MSLRAPEHPRPSRFLVHISDPHLPVPGERLFGTVDSARHLRTLLGEVEAAGWRPDALVLTGDLADRGSPEAYRLIREIVEAAAVRLGAGVVWVLGNHDDRAAFRQSVGDAPGAAPLDSVHRVGGLRIIALDTTVPGQHYGRLTEAQLDRLAQELRSPAPEGSILAMHHPPVPVLPDLELQGELLGQARLAEVLAGSDVRCVLAGHLHYSASATFAGIPVSVASASSYTVDLTAPGGALRGRDGAFAFNVVHVYPDTVLNAVVPLTHGRTLTYVGPEESARRLAAEGVVIGGSGPVEPGDPA